MSSFSVCWNRVRLEWRKHAERAPWAQEAVLCGRALIGGRPALRIIGTSVDIGCLRRRSDRLAVLIDASFHCAFHGADNNLRMNLPWVTFPVEWEDSDDKGGPPVVRPTGAPAKKNGLPTTVIPIRPFS